MNTERYLRQILFQPIGQEGQERLTSSFVVIVGCGAIGSTTAGLLARAGVGRLRIIDRDVLDESNLQRQELFDEEDLKEGLPKALAATRKLQRINSSISVEGLVTNLNPVNAETLLKDAQLILDGTDNFETRLLLNDYAVKTRTPWIYAACLASEAMLMNIIPGKTACLRCMLDSAPLPGSMPTCETAGIIAPAAKLIASLQATEALKILTCHYESLLPELIKIDLWKGTFKKVNMASALSNTCPTCQKGEYTFLNARGFSLATTLCGSKAVQITPPNGARIDLSALSRRLQSALGAGRVSQTPHLLMFEIKGHEVIVFPDGRTLIFGTQDTSLAQTLYSQYIGI